MRILPRNTDVTRKKAPDAPGAPPLFWIIKYLAENNKCKREDVMPFGGLAAAIEGILNDVGHLKPLPKRVP